MHLDVSRRWHHGRLDTSRVAWITWRMACYREGFNGGGLVTEAGHRGTWLTGQTVEGVLRSQGVLGSKRGGWLTGRARHIGLGAKSHKIHTAKPSVQPIHNKQLDELPGGGLDHCTHSGLTALFVFCCVFIAWKGARITAIVTDVLSAKILECMHPIGRSKCTWRCDFLSPMPEKTLEWPLWKKENYQSCSLPTVPHCSTNAAQTLHSKTKLRDFPWVK